MAIKHPRVGRILFLYRFEFGTEVCDPMSDSPLRRIGGAQDEHLVTVSQSLG